MLIVDNTVYLLKHFNKRKIELELETWSLNSSTQEHFRDISGIERTNTIEEDGYVKSCISIPWEQ